MIHYFTFILKKIVYNYHGQRPIQRGPLTGVGPNPSQGHNLGMASTTPQRMIVAADCGNAVSALM